MHIHLDPLGGIAGDMFIAAMSNAFPELRLRIERVIAEANFSDVSIHYYPKNDGVLTGFGFRVEAADSSSNEQSHLHGHDHPHESEHSHGHGHPLESEHSHSHGHDHPHESEHSHGHGHPLESEHSHSHGHDHPHESEHSHGHDHPREFEHSHGHDHPHESEHSHGHDHPRGFEHSHGLEHSDEVTLSQEHGNTFDHPQDSLQDKVFAYQKQECELDNLHEHGHRSYKEIREIIQSAILPVGVREHALNIFRIIGEAESEVHGVDIEVISFHEVGGWDSVIDVIGAACVLDYLSGATWSYSSIPKGGGFIKTAHGRLPVPPPAVALLLRGFVFHDDGALGERVTPTGAAILKYLQPSRKLPTTLELKGVGHGFGTKKFPGFSNVLRALFFDVEPIQNDRIAVLNFEVDDMTGEELSVALDDLRNSDGVLDVIQSSAYGKKNRVVMSIQVLSKVESFEQIIKHILSKTTTLGVRHQVVSRTIVPREISSVDIGVNTVRVKVAGRPDGSKSAKVEVDDLSSVSSNCHDMRKLAEAAEKSVLKEIHDEHN